MDCSESHMELVYERKPFRHQSPYPAVSLYSTASHDGEAQNCTLNGPEILKSGH